MVPACLIKVCEGVLQGEEELAEGCGGRGGRVAEGPGCQEVGEQLEEVVRAYNGLPEGSGRGRGGAGRRRG